MTTFDADALLDAWSKAEGIAFAKSRRASLYTENPVWHGDLLTLIATAHAAGRAECETDAKRFRWLVAGGHTAAHYLTMADPDHWRTAIDHAMAAAAPKPEDPKESAVRS